jgi:hypothetical protein
MLRVSEFQPEYGLMAAGAVNSSFIGRLPGKARALGPVAGVSYRVASRIANTLRAGTAARSADELDAVRLILFHSTAGQHETLMQLLRSARIQWPGKSLLFCDSDAAGADYFRSLGASVAGLRSCAIPGRMVLEGSNPSLATAYRMVRDLNMKAIEIDAGSAPAFEAAITLGTAALTPLIDRTAGLLRRCDIRDGEALHLAAALFEKTAKEYSHSGRQSWAWYTQEPDVASLLRQIDAVGGDLKPLLAQLILSGLEELSRHPEVARLMRSALNGAHASALEDT